MANLRLVLVTPEKTLFDRPVASIKVPMFDGSAGIYPGRAPLVGRLGLGELALTDDAKSTESWLIEGGFVQVKGEQVSVLTQAATSASNISKAAASEELSAARAVTPASSEEREALSTRLEKARQMYNLAQAD